MINLDEILDSEFIDVPCSKECGRVVRVQKLVYEVFGSIACDDCCREHERQETQMAETEHRDDYEAICPPLYRETDINHEGFPLEQYEKVMRWKFNPVGLLLVGETDRGKTRCMFKLIERLVVKEHHKVKGFFPEDFRLRVSDNLKTEKRATGFLKEFSEVDVLFLDDLFADKLSESLESFIFGLIDARIRWKRPMLITTQRTNEEFAALAKDKIRAAAIIRRLRDFCTIIEF